MRLFAASECMYYTSPSHYVILTLAAPNKMGQKIENFLLFPRQIPSRKSKEMKRNYTSDLVTLSEAEVRYMLVCNFTPLGVAVLVAKGETVGKVCVQKEKAAKKMNEEDGRYF